MKINGSKINLEDHNDPRAKEFLSIIPYLFETEEVQKLAQCHQHLDTSRLQHCLNVTYYTYTVCKKYNLNTYEATRAALLHDLFYYDYFKDKDAFTYHARDHSVIAEANAEKLTELSPMMKNAITSHMFPLVTNIPSYKESWVITSVDKYCAVIEFADCLIDKVKNCI